MYEIWYGMHRLTKHHSMLWNRDPISSHATPSVWAGSVPSQPTQKRQRGNGHGFSTSLQRRVNDRSEIRAMVDG